MLASPPLMSEFMGMVSYARTCFLDLMDDDVESDGSSIGDVAPSHRPSWECAMADAPGQPPVVAESLQTHTPPDPHAGALALAQEHVWLHPNESLTDGDKAGDVLCPPVRHQLR